MGAVFAFVEKYLHSCRKNLISAELISRDKQSGGMPMDVEIDLRPPILLVRLSGELDHHQAVRMREKVDRELARSRPRAVLFNLCGLTFMDSSGVGALLGRYRKLAAAGRHMAVCEVPAAVSRITEMAGLARIIPFFDHEAAALQHLILGAPEPQKRRF